MKKEIVARLGAIGALVCVAGAGYLFLQHSGRDKTAAAGRHRTGRHPGDHGGRRAEGRPALRPRHWRGAGLQHRHHRDPRRRRDRQGRLHGGPGRESRRSPGPDRSATLPGHARRRPRPRGRSNQAQLGGANSTSSGTSSLEEPGQRVDRAERQQEGASRRARGQRSRPTRRRSTPRGSSSPTPRSARRSTAAPGSAWSISATSSRPRRPDPWSASPQIEPIFVNFTVPQDVDADVRRDRPTARSCHRLRPRRRPSWRTASWRSSTTRSIRPPGRSA